jgi:hypothetical protein
MAEAERLLLAGVHHLPGLLQDGGDGAELGRLAAVGEHLVEFDGMVEMVLERGLATARDEDEFLDAGRLRLLHRPLDERLVDHRQHLLGHGLGGRQETGPQAAHRKNRLANRFRHAPCPKRPSPCRCARSSRRRAAKAAQLCHSAGKVRKRARLAARTGRAVQRRGRWVRLTP